MAPPAPTFDTATLHLHVLGRDRELSFPVRVGPAELDDLLPPAREITEQITALAIADAAAEGRTVRCRAACAACCRQLVPISVLEARALARLVADLPPPRRDLLRARFADALARLEAVGLLAPASTSSTPARARPRLALQSAVEGASAAWDDVSRRYFAAQIPCPFLEDERCTVYADRPMVCREYNVTTPPERCAALDGGAETIARPVRMSEVLADAANAIAGLDLPSIPLTLALEWAELGGGALDGERDGEAMFWELVSRLDDDGRTPFDERPAAR